MSKAVANATANIYINGVSADNTLKELRATSARLKNELANLAPTTQEFIDKSKKLKEVDARIQEVNGSLKQTKGIFGQIQAEIGKFGMLAVGYLGFDAITGKIGSVIQRNADLSDSLADVRKTTGMTDEEVKRLNKSLGEFDTRSSRKELLELARDAGKLGITGTKDVEAFVRAANKIEVALGEDLGEEALTQIGKLVNVFQLKEKFGLEDAMLKVASSINTLGASSEASEGYLVNFLNRMGGIAPMANISIDQVLALGATLDSLGQTSEVSSTALSQLFIKMAEDATKYAKIAGVSTADFKRVMNENALEAFMMVLEGAGKTEGGIIELTATLGDLGIEGGRATGVFGALAKNTDMIRAQMDIASSSFEKGTSVIDEFTTKNTNLAANLEKVQKWIASAFTSSSINTFFGDLVGWMAKVISTPLSEKMEKERMELRKVELQLLDVNTKQETRVKLIKQLQTDYPGFLGNLSAEKVTNEQLSSAIKTVNDQLINKIILQKQDEKIEAQNAKVAEFRMKLIEREDALRTKIIQVAEKNNIQLKAGLTLEQQAIELYKKLGGNGDVIENLSSGRRGLNLVYNQYAMALQAVNREETNNMTLMNARAELEKRLGITQQDKAAVNEAAAGAGTSTQTSVPGIPSAKEQENAYQVAQQKLERYFNVEEKLIKERQLADIANKEAHSLDLQDLELRKLESMRELNARFGEDVTALDLQIVDKRLAIQADYIKREQEAKRLALETVQQAIDEEAALINENFANQLITEQERDMQLFDLQQNGLEMLKLVYAAYGDDVAALDRKISESRAAEEKKRAAGTKKHTKELVAYNKELIQAENELVLAKQQATLQILGMLTGFAQKHTLLYKALFIVQKAAAISEVIIRAQMEKAAISAWSAALGPAGLVAGMIARQAVNVRMGTSIALIAGQAIQELGGFKEGGYTGSGVGMPDKSGHKVAGVVHADEYVTPAWMVRSPKYANVIRYLETERVSRGGSSGNEIDGYARGGRVKGLWSRRMNPAGQEDFEALEKRFDEFERRQLNKENDNAEQVTTNELVKECRDLLIQIKDGVGKGRVIGDDELWKMQERTKTLNQYENNARM